MQLDSRGRKRPAPSDDEPLDWQRYQKYDVFNDLLTAAAASPAAQAWFSTSCKPAHANLSWETFTSCFVGDFVKFLCFCIGSSRGSLRCCNTVLVRCQMHTHYIACASSYASSDSLYPVLEQLWVCLEQPVHVLLQRNVGLPTLHPRADTACSRNVCMTSPCRLCFWHLK